MKPVAFLERPLHISLPKAMSSDQIETHLSRSYARPLPRNLSFSADLRVHSNRRLRLLTPFALRW